MKRALLSVGSGLCGLALGWFIAPASSPSPHQVGQGAHPSPPRSSRPSGPTSPTSSTHSLSHLRSLIRQGTPHHESLARHLEHLSLDELQALFQLPENQSGDSLDAFRNRIPLIAQEIFRRQGFDAFPWAIETDPRLRPALLSSLFYPASEASHQLALVWLKRLSEDPENHLESSTIHFVAAAEKGAAHRSAEDLAAFYNSDFPSMVRGDLGSVCSFPDPFDFSKLTRLTQDPSQLISAVTVWASRDPDAARQWVLSLEDPRLAARFLHPMLSGIAASEGDAQAAHHMATWLDHFSDDQRRQALVSLRGTAAVSGPEAQSILQALPTSQDRLTYASQVLSPWSPSSTFDSVLHCFPTPAAQTELLLHMAPSCRLMVSRGGEAADRVLQQFTQAMDRHQLPESSRQQVLDSLYLAPEEP
ncbi:hypothetical protein HNR46_001786 [Haloferula luteola]|uniref:HEAT repeat domain-containing protein n=1 Tax=Haloferula luteola TaxID=595692 RepID=A0A840VCL8_9BACT|nr:hypothetical protein [Haloferula luteola]MBB5351549.1 hypothetical protein [Haloferula luteola]